ncbi:MAG: inositol monophosphatase [Solirubrobacterales bacterium]
MRELALELATALRHEVRPHLGAHAGRAHQDDPGEGGDVTFAIDERAESFMESFLAERAPGVAFYSEDRGMIHADNAEWVLIVDPIDGTRPALAGFESCCVSVAAARLGDGEPTMADVEAGAIVEIKSGRAFACQRGGGLEPAPRLSATTDLSRMFWTYGLRGRPAMLLVGVLEELIDVSSVGGSTFDLGSATYDMTRIITGQLDAYVEPGPRIVEEVPGARAAFQRVGGGAILNNSPYDIAAAVLILEEAGAIVTDAWGQPLGKRPLLGSGHRFQMSCVAAANQELHTAICRSVDAGIVRLAANFA